VLGGILRHGTFVRLHFAAVVLVAGTAYAKRTLARIAHTQQELQRWLAS